MTMYLHLVVKGALMRFNCQEVLGQLSKLKESQALNTPLPMSITPLSR
jgi:hypothetical protein